MKSSKPAKPSKDNHKNGASDWLSVGTICLFAGGVLAAKAIFLVDNDLEIKTKFAGKSWQLNSQSVRQYARGIEKTTRPYLQSLGGQLRQQSTKLFTEADKALTNCQNLCIPTSELSNILARSRKLYPIESAHPPAKPDRVVKSRDQVVKGASRY